MVTLLDSRRICDKLNVLTSSYHLVLISSVLRQFLDRIQLINLLIWTPAGRLDCISLVQWICSAFLIWYPLVSQQLLLVNCEVRVRLRHQGGVLSLEVRESQGHRPVLLQGCLCSLLIDCWYLNSDLFIEMVRVLWVLWHLGTSQTLLGDGGWSRLDFATEGRRLWGASFIDLIEVWALCRVISIGIEQGLLHNLLLMVLHVLTCIIGKTVNILWVDCLDLPIKFVLRIYACLLDGQQVFVR
jgi:hypothetical protein